MLNEKINIYQIFYLDQQIPALDSAFIPYDNRDPVFGKDVSNKLREWPIIRQYGYQRAQIDKSDIWGFVSYKFTEKTNTTGQQFIDFIKSNSNNDVWFMQPTYMPKNPFFNPWTQGDVHHVGISDIANYLFELSGNKIDVRKIPMPFCWYNFFAGTPKFWNLFFALVDEIIALSSSQPGLQQTLFNTGAGHGNDITVPYFIFIVERMFPTLLALSGIKFAAMPYQHVDFVFG